MKAVVQRVIDAAVTVNDAEKGRISRGLLVYLGVAHEDTDDDARYLAEKIVHLRIFDDEDGRMNRSLIEVAARAEEAMPPIGVLAVSQFTLLADARKGRRPSWAKAAAPEKARKLYDSFIEKIRAWVPCASGEFQAHMRVSCTNDGPVTILLDSENE